jgi:diguanylate cyclase (GGDEF)-like protein
MGQFAPDTGQAQSATERLLEGSWEARERRASWRELIAEATAAVLFLASAVSLLLSTGATAGLRPEIAIPLIAVYALVARIEFPIGAGHVVPTQLVLVPMLVMLPPGAVPLAVCIGLVASSTVDWALGRVNQRRILSAVPDAWHAVGPAGVLVIAGSPAIGLNELPLLAVAFIACCLVDLGSSLARMRLTGVMPDLKLQMRVIGSVWVVDAALAPLGLVAAIATERDDAAILFVLPLAFLLWLLARDRSQRIAQAHRRLRLVEQERARLQSAVRRLGDAFAANLDLDALLQILLHGAVEALDADAGWIELPGVAEVPDLQRGSSERLALLERVARGDVNEGATLQACVDGVQTLSLPMTIGAVGQDITGTVRFARDGREFEDDEMALISELVSKAERAAGEILTHNALRTQVLTDALTGLGNRRKLNADLAIALERAGAGTPSLLLLFDLDGFKAYNDTFGHLAGDALLARMGAKLDKAVAGSGAAYRLGGDEFCARFELAGHDPDMLISRAAEALTESGRLFTIRASLGVVLLPHEADSADHALQLADERMYADKRRQPTGARSQARDVLLLTMQAKQVNLDEHSSQVAELASLVARKLGLGGEDLDEIARAAELHDVGKVGIPDAILNKPGFLDAAEWEFIHQHTILGERILYGAPALRPIARLVRSSHERWDGAGYPDGLRGEEIPLGARIVSVCDAYEAMTADRSYRDAVSHTVACGELRAAAGTQFDPAVVDAFLAATTHAEIGLASDEPERDAISDAAAHVRTLLRA